MDIDNSKRSQTYDGIEYRFSSDWIHDLEGKEHWRSYWHQLRMILPALEEGDDLLEIGPGTGFLSNYLKSKGYRVTTLDIDDRKSPDIVANLVAYPFPDVYDHILAFEVFEHIPFEKFTEILPKLKKSSRKNIFLSIPRNFRIWFHADLIIPYFKDVTFSIKTKRRKIIVANHFWELNYKQYTLRSLIRIFNEAGFECVSIKKVKTMVILHLKPNH
jgi:2-polyprenyl-3-methyl-5-hydroxy-6-metoxy-1,4-benzoquinol methylase